jgi:hypothetical protein
MRGGGRDNGREVDVNSASVANFSGAAFLIS